MSILARQARPIIRNDLRLFWREMQGPHRGYLTHALLVFLILLMQGIILVGMWKFRTPPPPGVEVLGIAYLALLMLGGAINRSVQLLYTRSDFDLLMSSPIPPRAVLLARLGSVALTAFFSACIFAAPVLNGAILRLSPRYLAGYAVVALISVLAAAIGTGICVALVRSFGARVARFIAIGIAATLAGSFPLAMTLTVLLPKAKLRDLQQGFAQLLQHPAMGFMAGANRGSPLPLALLTLVTLVAVVVVLRWLTRTFVTQLQDNNASPARCRGNFRHRWIEGLGPATMRKEFRLIARSPLLLVQLLPAGILVIPIVVIAVKFAEIRAVAPATLFFAAFFSFLLADVAASGEVGWDLVRLSPAAEFRLRRWIMAACLAVPLLVATVLSGWIAVAGRPWLALVTLATTTICAAGTAWVEVVTVGPSPRYDLIQPPNPSVDLRQLFAQVILFPGALGLGFCAYEFYLLATPFLGVAGICVIASFTLLEPRPTP
ncbi:MAG: hypothetical protein EXS37_01935 [Opitutus sp.]|nr:hypothetical protein [Opitutus sp.]